MNRIDTKKITALGVVIFSFASLALCTVIIALFSAAGSLLVLKTNLPESALKLFSVVGSGGGIIAATVLFTIGCRLKGIVGAGVIAGAVIIIKMIGNALMNLGGYLSLSGMIGIIFVVLFALIGGILASAIKRR